MNYKINNNNNKINKIIKINKYLLHFMILHIIILKKIKIKI